MAARRERADAGEPAQAPVSEEGTAPHYAMRLHIRRGRAWLDGESVGTAIALWGMRDGCLGDALWLKGGSAYPPAVDGRVWNPVERRRARRSMGRGAAALRKEEKKNARRLVRLPYGRRALHRPGRRSTPRTTHHMLRPAGPADSMWDAPSPSGCGVSPVLELRGHGVGDG